MCAQIKHVNIRRSKCVSETEMTAPEFIVHAWSKLHAQRLFHADNMKQADKVSTPGGVVTLSSDKIVIAHFFGNQQPVWTCSTKRENRFGDSNVDEQRPLLESLKLLFALLCNTHGQTSTRTNTHARTHTHSHARERARNCDDRYLGHEPLFGVEAGYEAREADGPARRHARPVRRRVDAHTGRHGQF